MRPQIGVFLLVGNLLIGTLLLSTTSLASPCETVFSKEEISQSTTAAPEITKSKPNLLVRIAADLWTRLKRLPQQFLMISPFRGSIEVERLSFFRWASVASRNHNLADPLKILEYIFKTDGDLKYLDIPGFAPILFVRGKELIKEVAAQTSNGGKFERDTLPTNGIGREVGDKNLLRAQGEEWARHKKAAAKPLGGAQVHREDVYKDLEANLRETVQPQLEALRDRIKSSADGRIRMKLAPEIRAVMLTLLVRSMFGADLPPQEIRTKYLGAVERVIRHIVRDTVTNLAGISPYFFQSLLGNRAKAEEARAAHEAFEELTELMLANRDTDKGFWPFFKIMGAEDAVRSNVRVFLAGALEATTSFVTATLGHLARNPEIQEEVYREALAHPELTPSSRAASQYLQRVFNESLRMSPPLYFLPRVAQETVTVETSLGTLTIPKGTHLILDTHHTNRMESEWGVEQTGFPAEQFAPQRWDPLQMAAVGRQASSNLHFGFGYGPRVCIGRNFAEAEGFVLMNLFSKAFKITAVNPEMKIKSGISAQQEDEVDVFIELRNP